ncbi:MAG: MCE family protein, partial [Actinomycetales bacterium]
MRRSRLTVAVLVSTAALAVGSLAGCSTSAQDLPLPGSRVQGDAYRLTAEFTDALNLADGAAVKMNGVPIGRVRSITVKDFTARVQMDIERARRLPVGSTARLRSTTPLGELFVQVDAPDESSTTSAALSDGDVLGRDRTSVAPTIEDTMSAASMLVNGGGLGQIETIVEEANAVLGGREGTARDALRRLAATAKSLNDSDDDISAALDALARVSKVLDRRKDVVVAALRDVRPAAKVLRENTDELAALLKGIDSLGTTVVDVVERSGDDLRSMLSQTGPIFEELNTVEKELRPGLQTVIGFAKLIDEAVPAEYLNTYLYFQTEVSIGVPNLPLLGDPGLPRIDTPDLTPDAPGDDGGGLTGLPSLELPDLTGGAEDRDGQGTGLDLGLGGLLG